MVFSVASLLRIALKQCQTKRSVTIIKTKDQLMHALFNTHTQDKVNNAKTVARLIFAEWRRRKKKFTRIHLKEQHKRVHIFGIRFIYCYFVSCSIESEVLLAFVFDFFLSLQTKEEENRLNIGYNNIISNVVNNHGLCDTHSKTSRKYPKKAVQNKKGD